MSLAPFAALESRLNGAVLKRLANATATIGGAVVPGIFDNGYALGNVGMSGMASTQPVFTLNTDALAGEVVGKTIHVNGGSYLVAAHEPDGTGMSRLLLEAA